MPVYMCTSLIFTIFVFCMSKFILSSFFMSCRLNINHILLPFSILPGFHQLFAIPPALHHTSDISYILPYPYNPSNFFFVISLRSLHLFALSTPIQSPGWVWIGPSPSLTPCTRLSSLCHTVILLSFYIPCYPAVPAGAFILYLATVLLLCYQP